MCAKNYQIWLERFKDKSKNVRWPRLLDHDVDGNAGTAAI